MTLQFITQNKLVSYSILTGVYGFARSFNGNHIPEHNVIGDKLALSFLNGVMYSIPPYSVIYHFKLLNRIDVKLNGKDPALHKNSYEDMFSYNLNVFL
jgi:hypothetical protein